MSTRSYFGNVLREQFQVHKRVVAEEDVECVTTLHPTIYTDVPRPDQSMNSGGGTSDWQFLSCPEGFFGVDHPNTTWLVNLLKDTSEWRLHKSVASMRSRPLFNDDKYYQLIDRPTYYCGQAAKLENPLFNSQAMLYLNAFGVALYMKCGIGCHAMASCRVGRCQVVSTTTLQYASFVHNRKNDLACFTFEFMCFKREYYDGLECLALIDWNPMNISLFTYRRDYYQYSVPFTDWIDVVRHLLLRKPNMNVGKLIDRMYYLQYVIGSGYHFSMSSMKQIGRVMMESFELKELTKQNFSDITKFGLYAGRKVLKNKDTLVGNEYEKVFSDAVMLRPVMPNVMSYVRRLLTFQYYFDGRNLFALPQVIRAVLCFKKHGFFIASQSVKNSVVRDTTDHHCVYLDPLIFQLSYFVNMKSGGSFLRHKDWNSRYSPTDAITEEERGWYYRFDTFNCLSLLAGLLQNCLIKNMPETIVESLCDLIVHVLVDSEMIEPFFRYSYYDTYFGLTSVINCVPNLMSKTVLRLLRKAPITLVSNYEIAQLQRMFTATFMANPDAPDTAKGPSTVDEMARFLAGKRRKVSMRVEGPQTGEAMSGASAMGAGGNVTIFVRNYADMAPIMPADEAAVQPASETTKKQDEERKHVIEYKQMEVDARYSAVFNSYYDGLNKVKVQYDETKMYEQCRRDAINNIKLTSLME